MLVGMFATCSYPEFDPARMPGVPVRASNGVPRYRLAYPLRHHLPAVVPQWVWVQSYRDGHISADEFTRRYSAMIRHRQGRIEREASAIRERAGVDGDTPLVLLCFERLHKPGGFCHRQVFARVWSELTCQEVPELGREPVPQHTLF